MSHIFTPKQGESFFLSAESFANLLKRPIDPEFPQRNIIWTDDFKTELPIKRSSDGIGAEEPETLIDAFRRASIEFEKLPALSVKRDDKWVTLTFLQYYKSCLRFAAGLLAYKFPEYTSINIIGFNSPEWAIAFFGSLFARSIATGIYTTNSQQICEFIAENSECKVLVAENVQYLQKYSSILKQRKIKLIIVYNDPKADLTQFGENIIHWEEFLKSGDRVDIITVEKRMNMARPGNCATLVYTSGTTGMPKGVMLSHDNLTWTKKSMDAYHQREPGYLRIVSYLPLSHVAGLFADLITPLMCGYHVYFAKPDALQGTLIETLKEVRPNAFFSVPRVWEKIDEKMKQIAKSNGWLKTKIATWAKSIGPEGTIQEVRNQQTSFKFKLAKTLIYNQIKKQLGLDQCTYYLYGAAPLDPQIRHYFLSLNFFLINSYGMSESTGPQNFSNKDAFDYTNNASLMEVGSAIPGTEIKIMKNNPLEEDGT